MNRNLYGIMIKYPEPGKVKTRLGKQIGLDRAAGIYGQVVQQIIHGTAPPKTAYARIIFYDPPERLDDFKRWLPGNPFVPQQGNNVGERMDSAIRELLARGAEKAVLTGADIPKLNTAIISGAFAALDHADIVIGPAKDGGYYLIGMKESHGEIFEGIPWSTEKVLAQTLRTIAGLQLTVARTIMLSDIDRAEDLANFPDP